MPDTLHTPLRGFVRQSSLHAREPKRTPLGRGIVALFTVVGVGTSFLTFQTVITALSNISQSGFQPCNDGCTFIRYFGGGNVPPSAAAFLNCGSNSSDVKYCNSTTPTHLNNFSDQIPGFMQITNGNSDIEFAPFPVNLNLILAMSLWKSETPYTYAFASPECPDRDVPMQAKCDQADMKSRIRNHLTDAPSLTALRGFIFVWAVMLVAHELLVLYQAPDALSTLVGMLSTAAHISTTASAFLWALGATDVFLAEDPNQPCGCYYTLPALNCLLMLATPALMQKTTWDMLWKTALGLLHGDFLHTVSYSVPMRMVCSSELADPTTTFLPPTANGDTQHAAPLLPHKHLHGDSGLNCLKLLQSQVSLFIIAYFSAPPLISKVVMITRQGVQQLVKARVAWMSQERWFALPAAMSASPNVGMAMAMTMACLFGPLFCMYKQWNPVQVTIRESLLVLKNRNRKSPFNSQLSFMLLFFFLSSILPSLFLPLPMALWLVGLCWECGGHQRITSLQKSQCAGAPTASGLLPCS